MLHVGLDLSRTRLDVAVLDEQGVLIGRTAVAPEEAGLAHLVALLGAVGQPVRAAIESMTGARYVRDVLADAGWQVDIGDAALVKRLAPLACKTDRIDAWVLAELCRRDLVPAIWLPPMRVRQEREQVRFRRHLVKHRSMLKSRIHSTLMSFGIPNGHSDLFGPGGRRALARLRLPEPWASDVAVAVEVIDALNVQIDELDRRLHAWGARHPYVPRLMTAPGIGWVLGCTIAAEIGDISRFSAPAKLVGYTGLCPRVYQSGHTDRRGPLAKNGPAVLRWAMIEAAVHATDHPAYRDRYQRTRARLGRQRGPRVARVELARDLTNAVWHMLTRGEDFTPAGARSDLAA